MPETKEIVTNLTEKQTKAWDILDDDSISEVLFDGGVRSGKTFVKILWLTEFALQNPGAFILIGRRFFAHCKKSIWLQTMEPLLEKTYPRSLWKVNKQDWIITFKGNSQIWLSGFDDARRVSEIMGREYIIAYLNEATEIDPDMVTKVKTRLAQKLEKKTSNGHNEYHKPKLMFDCNPVHPEFYLNQRFIDKDNGKQCPSGKARLHWTIWDNKENLTPEYIAELEKSLNPLEKQRLLQGLWIGSGNFVNKNVNENCFTDSYDIKDYQYTIAGIDWGYVSVFNLWKVKDNEAICILDVELKDKITSEFLEVVKDKLKEINIHPGSFPSYCDHEPDRIEEANRMGFDAKKAYKDVSAGDSSVNWFNIKFLMDCTATYNSMRFLENEKGKDGVVIEGKHTNLNAHAADSSRYALHSYRMDYASAEFTYKSVTKKRFTGGRKAW